MTVLRRLYGRGPLHLLGHLAVIAVTAYALSIMFQMRFAPQPLNLALWLLGGAILHDVVFLPLYGVANALFSRGLGASDRRPLRELAMGRPAEAEQERAADLVPAAADSEATRPGPETGALAGAEPTTRDARRRVPVVNYVRVPFVVSAMLLLVFLPRILNRQPQNFVNALGTEPPDFAMRWVVATLVLFAVSAALYAIRWVRARPLPAAGAASA